MPRQVILIADRDDERASLIEDYFSDTRSRCVRALTDRSAETYLNEKPSVLFVATRTCSSAWKDRLEQWCRGANCGTVFLLDGEESGWNRGWALPHPSNDSGFEERMLEGLEFPPQMKILIVDDEAEIRVKIKEYLEGRQKPAFAVEEASNGLEGFEKIDRWRPDLAIFDIKMPVKDGPALYGEVRRRFPDLRVVFLSSLAGAEEIGEVRRWGTVAVIEKGAVRNELRVLENVIKKQWYFS